MKKAEYILAALLIVVMLVGWGMSIATVSNKADDGVEALAKVHAVELDIGRIQTEIKRLPIIESKLDVLIVRGNNESN